MKSELLFIIFFISTKAFLEDLWPYFRPRNNISLVNEPIMATEFNKAFFDNIKNIQAENADSLPGINITNEANTTPKERFLKDIAFYPKNSYHETLGRKGRGFNKHPVIHAPKIITNPAKDKERWETKGINPSRFLRGHCPGINRFKRSIQVLSRNILNKNKFFCRNRGKYKKKLCVQRCRRNFRCKCYPCRREVNKVLLRRCRRKRFSRLDRSLYRTFKNNGANCLVKEMKCQDECRRYCNNARKNPKKCYDCQENCEKAADVNCLSGTELISKYNSGRGMFKSRVNDFMMRPFLCVDKALTCTNICDSSCQSGHYSRRCKHCRYWCEYSGRKACVYIPQDSILKKMIRSLKRNKSYCANRHKFCKTRCNRDCRNNPSTFSCKKCAVGCHAIFGIVCKKASSFHRSYLRKKSIFNYYYYGIFKLFNAKCSDINLACDEHCAMPCMFINNDKLCKPCKKTCKYSAGKACQNISNDSLTSKLFSFFYSDPIRCKSINHLCLTKCKKRQCKGNKSFNSGCRKCLKNCNYTGHAACDISRHKIARMNTLFNDLQKYFRKKRSSLSCNQCYSERDLICNWKCGHNYKCSKDCKNIGLRACLSVCKGDYSTFYKKIFNSKFQQEFSSRKVQCNLCSTECSKKCKINCNPNDHRCKKFCNNICKRSCNSINCQGKKNPDAKSAFSKANAEKYFKKRLDVELKRFKTAEEAKIEYDERIEHKKRFKVFRNNREKLLNTIELGEGAIYEEQKKLADSQHHKALNYEEKVMKDIKDIYSNRAEYNDKRNLDLAIFED